MVRCSVLNLTRPKLTGLLLDEGLEYTIKDKGINVHTDQEKIRVTFDPDRFRPAEVPIMLADTRKYKK